MNLILEKSKFVDCYTYLDPIFEAVPELENFYYLISDFEIGLCHDERLLKESVVISGRELREIVQNQRIQFIWAVLSAFECESIVADELPYADGNSDFWIGEPKPQLDDAKFEIVCWDSGSTLFIGIDEAMATKLKKRFPDIRDLNIENRSRVR